MSESTHNDRLDRLEQAVQVLVEDSESLQKTVASLATGTRQAFDRVAELFAETDRRMRETDRSMREADERIRRDGEQRSRALDERVDKLVSAIGEFLRRQN